MYQPVLISSGLAGWQFLKSTQERQFATFNTSADIKRDTEYFAENIGKVRTASDLVSDRRMLSVALGAFGLQGDIDNTFFIQKMLSEGTTATDALANRFTDKRYRAFSAAFGLGPGERLSTQAPEFAQQIIEGFQANRFEVLVGNQDETMRIALYAERTIGDVAGGSGSEAQKWFSIMGQPPLRTLFETAFGLPTGFGQIDIDRQLEVFREKSIDFFGTSDPAALVNPDNLNRLLTTFIVQSQLNDIDASASGAAVALALLQS